MLCCEQKLDLKGSNRSWEIRWASIWKATTRSGILGGKVQVFLQIDDTVPCLWGLIVRVCFGNASGLQ